MLSPTKYRLKEKDTFIKKLPSQKMKEVVDKERPKQFLVEMDYYTPVEFDQRKFAVKESEAEYLKMAVKKYYI
jgi:hypothetical protein